MLDVRTEIVKIEDYWVSQHHMFDYNEGVGRMDWRKDLPEIIRCYKAGIPLTVRIKTDCSGKVTLTWHVAGAPDPNGLNYDGEGYTGTELSHDKHMAQWIKNNQGVRIDELAAGFLVVYGPGTGWHVATIVEVHGPDILTVSHGKQGDPSFVWVNPPKVLNSRGYPVDGRMPQTFLKCNTINPNKMPPVAKPTQGAPHPKAA